MYCPQCNNTGRVAVKYLDIPPLCDTPVPTGPTVQITDIEIKTREVECPKCLGFGAVGRFLPP